jgi:hypothetical protein
VTGLRITSARTLANALREVFLLVGFEGMSNDRAHEGGAFLVSPSEPSPIVFPSPPPTLRDIPTDATGSTVTPGAHEAMLDLLD